jgi:hypothetical protein
MPGVLDSGGLWSSVEEGIARLCDAWTNDRLLPLLEADFAGYLYHLLVTDCGGDARFIHLETRLARSGSRAKFDLVIGRVLTTTDQRESVLDSAGFPEDARRFVLSKTSLPIFRPGVLPMIVLEFKGFPVGFTFQQHAVHFKEALDDLSKLKTVADVCPHGRGVVLFDGDGYLGNRIGALLEKRSAEDGRIRVYVCSRDSNKGFCWNLH